MTFDSLKATRQCYQCVDCGHFDSYVAFEGERIPDAIQCADCKSGSGLATTVDMIRAGKGMRRVTQEHRNQYDQWTSPTDYQRLDINRPVNSVIESSETVN